MPLLLAAPDKFRGTATAAGVAAACAAGARGRGWDTDVAPMSDGGEGFLSAVGGQVRHTRVTGPLGEPVLAEWRWIATPATGALADMGLPRVPGPLAVVEMAQAAGRALVPRPRGEDPVRASTAGVGEVIGVAVASGARTVVVGCGGSATTDGGQGAWDALGGPGPLAGVVLLAAADVTVRFGEAARLFGPQKGATPAQVRQLEERLASVSRRYQLATGLDVGALAGAGAGGGLAGGLAALGARIVPGFSLVAAFSGLAERMDAADAAVTGEGFLDATSFAGKVVGGLGAMASARGVPLLCIAGNADPAAAARLPPGVDLAVLTARVGEDLARREPLALVAQTVAEWLAGLPQDRSVAAPTPSPGSGSGSGGEDPQARLSHLAACGPRRPS